jgi:two-component system response regulator RegA
MRLEDGNGLTVVNELRNRRPDARIVMLTGYGNIATAVAAVKAGRSTTSPSPPTPTTWPAPCWPRRRLAASAREPMSADRVAGSTSSGSKSSGGHNVSETARRLNMHRRTLQRILAKRAPR